MTARLRSAWEILTEAYALWNEKNAFQSAGALAFFTLFSMAPLLIVVITITGIVLGEDAVRGQITGEISRFIGPQAAEVVENAVDESRFERAGMLPTILGVLAMVLGATSVFAQMQAALNALWDVRAKPSRGGVTAFFFTRLISLGMIMALGFVLLTSFLASVALATVIEFAEHWIPIPGFLLSTVDVVVSFVVVTLVFATIFRVLPDVELTWRQTRLGAMLTAVLFALGQFLISLYLTRAGPASAYGAAGALVVILLWVYYSSLILFLGAAVTRVLITREGDRIDPSRGAVKIETSVVEDTGAPVS